LRAVVVVIWFIIPAASNRYGNPARSFVTCPAPSYSSVHATVPFTVCCVSRFVAGSTPNVVVCVPCVFDVRLPKAS